MQILSIVLIFASVLLALVWSLIHYSSITKIQLGRIHQTPKAKPFLSSTRTSST